MKIVLFINGKLGFRVLDFVSDLQDYKLSGVVLNSDVKRAPSYLEEVEGLIRAKSLVLPILLWNRNDSPTAELESLLSEVNFGVSALFGHILPAGVIRKFSGGILNLHPSLLPIGRGADPVPWGIIERQKHGITLHLMDESLDTGDIIYQKEIYSDSTMNAGEIYEIAMSELFKAFSSLFVSWTNGQIQAKPQSKTTNSRHKSSDLDLMRVFKDSEIGTFGEFIRRIQATSFSNGNLPKYTDSEGKTWDIAIKILKPEKNEQEWK